MLHSQYKVDPEIEDSELPRTGMLEETCSRKKIRTFVTLWDLHGSFQV